MAERDRRDLKRQHRERIDELAEATGGPQFSILVDVEGAVFNASIRDELPVDASSND
jgi:hypothetical protein